MEKRMLYSTITQSGRQINASKFFKDLQDIVDKDKANGIELDRHHPAKKLINRFSGGYFSPSMIKGFNDCPAQQFYGSLMPWVGSDITAIGQSVHLIFQEFYNSKPEKRIFENLDIITNDVIDKNNQEKQRKVIEMYVQGFKDTPDYLDISRPMDHKNLVCYNELFMKGEDCHPLGVKIPLPIYCLTDRLDFRDEGVYVIDYKTGTYLNPKISTMQGYAPQLMCYGWMSEALYGEKIKGAYLLIPGTKQKILEVKITGLQDQSMYIERIFKYKEDIQRIAKTRIFNEKTMQYCKSCKFNKYCNLANNKNEDIEIPVEYDITLPEPEIKKENKK